MLQLPLRAWLPRACAWILVMAELESRAETSARDIDGEPPSSSAMWGSQTRSSKRFWTELMHVTCTQDKACCSQQVLICKRVPVY